MAAARGGDREAFEELVRKTTAGTYALAYRLTGDAEDARDVVQDAYLRAFRGLRRFRGDAQFTTWLYRITANCAATTLTRRARTRTEALPEGDTLVDARPDHDPQLQVGAAWERARLTQAVEALPWRLRQVLVLRDVYDLPHRAIADELGITEAAAKVRLHRARRQLREALGGAGQVGEGPVSPRPAAGAPEGRAVPTGPVVVPVRRAVDTDAPLGGSKGRANDVG